MNKKIIASICLIIGILLLLIALIINNNKLESNNEEFVERIISSEILNQEKKYKNITCFNLTINELSKNVYNLFFEVRNDSNEQVKYSFQINVYNSLNQMISSTVVSVDIEPNGKTGISNSIEGDLSNAHHYEIVDIEEMHFDE